MIMKDPSIIVRKPDLTDGCAIHDLVSRSHPLDLNSLYCYLLLCDHFRDTCIVAEHESSIVGFISAYVPPAKGETLFIWQVAVDDSMRNRSLATTMLQELLVRNPGSVSFLETTVNPSNQASMAFFSAFARRRAAVLTKTTCYGQELFGPGSGHEEEILIRIGPITEAPDSITITKGE